MEVPRLGVESELQVPATATATPDWAKSTTYTTAHGNPGSLIHWARPGIEPAPSWILVGFVDHWARKGTPQLNTFLCNLISSLEDLGTCS